MARGSITKYQGRRGSSWHIRIDAGTDPSGKRLQQRFTVQGTKREAEAKLTELLRQLDTRTYVDPSRTTVAEFLARWYQTHRQGLAPITVRRYANYLNLHIIPAIGTVPLQKLTPLQVQELVNTMVERGVTRWGKVRGASPKSIQDCTTVLKQALDRAVEWGMLMQNPAARVRLPKRAQREIEVLTEEQAAKVLEALRGCWAYMPTLIAFHTGMRMGEVLALSWSAVDLESGCLEVRRSYSIADETGPVFKEPKTRAGRRTVDIGRTLVEALREHRVRQLEQRLQLGEAWRNGHDLVCCHEDGQFIEPPTMGSKFARCLKRTGARGSFHGLRHAHVSLLIKAGVPINVVSARVGHANPSITHNIYAHLLPGMNRMAADVFERLIAAEETVAGAG